MADPDLSSAYAIRSPEDCLVLYRDFARTYDAGFAGAMQYRLPAHVAGAFVAAGGRGPVLDVGAGTGLLAEALGAQGFKGDIDGIDLSPEMLEKAAAKDLYRRLVQADVTRPLPLSERYGGVVSSGTFTHGHVGPEALVGLLAIAEPGAVFALSINTRVYTAQGFDTALVALGAAITGLSLLDVPIYGTAAAGIDPEHAADRACIALFRKA